MSERDWQKDWETCERATSGKWEMVSANCPEGPYMIRMPYPKGGTWYGVRMIAWKEDAEFIAESREALPYWLRRYKELHAKWIADTEEKIRLRYTNQQLQEELVRLKDIILQFARYADDHKTVLICPEETPECNSLCSACWQAALDGRKEVKQDD